MTQPANGTVVITGGGDRPDLRAERRTTATARPGPRPTRSPTRSTAASTATVSVTVTCVDDAPGGGQRHGDGGRGLGARPRSTCWPTTPTSTAARRASQSVTQPANGTVVITGGGTGADLHAERELLQQPARHVARHVHLHAERRLDRDGVGDGDVRGGRAGRRHLGGHDQLHRERCPDARSTRRVTVTDPDGSSITGATVQISANYRGRAGRPGALRRPPRHHRDRRSATP